MRIDVRPPLNRGDLMARIIVTTDRSEQPSGAVLLDERVYPVHLATDHAATQLIERLAWAVRDAERSEQTTPAR
jgi:hypothetical protein